MPVDGPTPVISTSSSVSIAIFSVESKENLPCSIRVPSSSIRSPTPSGLTTRHHVHIVFVLGFQYPRLDLIKRHSEVQCYLFGGSERTRHNNGFCCTSKTHWKNVVRVQ